jgi:hypothetical protein
VPSLLDSSSPVRRQASAHVPSQHPCQYESALSVRIIIRRCASAAANPSLSRSWPARPAGRAAPPRLSHRPRVSRSPASHGTHTRSVLASCPPGPAPGPSVKSLCESTGQQARPLASDTPSVFSPVTATCPSLPPVSSSCTYLSQNVLACLRTFEQRSVRGRACIRSEELLAYAYAGAMCSTARQELSRRRVGLASPDNSDTHDSNGGRAHVCSTVHWRGRRGRRGSGGGVTSYTSAASVEDRSRLSYRLHRGGSGGGLETSRG